MWGQLDRSRWERRWCGRLQLLDRHVAERDRVVVAGEAEEAGGALLARVRRLGHVFGDLGQVSVEDDGAVELDFDLGALDRYLLEIPLADGMLVAAGGGGHAVGRAVVLALVEL